MTTNTPEEFAGLNDKQKRIAAFHVTHPEASQGACYREEYQDTTKASARRRGSVLFKRDDFRLYCETLRASASALLITSPYFAKLRQAITESSGQDAIDIVAEMGAGVLEELLDPEATTPEVVTEQINKGQSEARIIDRPLNFNEKLAGRKFIATLTQTFAKEQAASSPVVVIRTDTKPEKVEVDPNATYADIEKAAE